MQRLHELKNNFLNFNSSSALCHHWTNKTYGQKRCYYFVWKLTSISGPPIYLTAGKHVAKENDMFHHQIPLGKCHANFLEQFYRFNKFFYLIFVQYSIIFIQSDISLYFVLDFDGIKGQVKIANMTFPNLWKKLLMSKWY